MRWLIGLLFLLVSLKLAAAHSVQMPMYRSTSAVHSPTEIKLVIFGDSLSDNGNSFELSQHQKPSAPIYYQGRFSNGPIWIDYISNVLFPNTDQAKILNYAFGGAGVLRSQPHVFILSQEIDSYLLTHSTQPDSDTWFILWIGANDYLLHPDSKAADVDQVIVEMEWNLSRLALQGAKHIVVMGLPDLGVLPYAEDLEVQSPLSNLTYLHNQQLQELITKLKHQFLPTDWHYIDINQTFIALMTHPKQYGFAYTHARCFVPDLSVPIKDKATWTAQKQKNCRKFVFFDQFHPTTFVHHLVANELLKNMKW